MNSGLWFVAGVAVGGLAVGGYCVLWVRRAAERATASRRGPIRPVTDYSQNRITVERPVWEEVHDPSPS